MIEKEAKTKWCPFVQQIGTLRKGEDNTLVAMGSQNRGYQMGGALHNCMCLASECMMWRQITKKPTEGYCGLAGKL
jgi:hypothetical protein